MGIFTNETPDGKSEFSILKVGLMAAGVIGGGMLMGGAEGFSLIGALVGGGAAVAINHFMLSGKKDPAAGAAPGATPGGGDGKAPDGLGMGKELVNGLGQQAFGQGGFNPGFTPPAGGPRHGAGGGGQRGPFG